MKNLLLLSFVLILNVSFAQEKKSTIVISTPTSCNHCKICESCGGKLEKDLYFVRGIKVVTYNEEAMTTTIVYKTKLITPEQIRVEISKLGFDADTIPADPKAYARRDDCCKP